MQVRGDLDVKGSIAIKIAHFREQQASGVNSTGTLTVGAWSTRVLNTSVSNTITGCSLGSNRVTLPAGRYYIKGVGTAVAADAVSPHKWRCRIQDITNNPILLVGPSMTTINALGEQIIFLIPVEGIIVLAGITQIELQHYTNATTSSGLQVGITATDEVYAELFIQKL